MPRGRAVRPPRWDPARDRWVYLGTDWRGAHATARFLGRSSRLTLDRRLDAAARTLRQPFLDFVTALGATQEDQIGWWSSTLAWKSPHASDVFLLLCYAKVVDGLHRESPAGTDASLLIVIEDPWLYHQLRRWYAHDPQVQTAAAPGLAWWCLRQVASGVARRLRWVVKLTAAAIRQRRVSRTPLVLPPPDRPGALLYSEPQRRAFVGVDGWADPYLGDVDRLLRECGYTVVRFASPDSLGFERELAARRAYFISLILLLTPAALLRALLAVWRLRRPSAPSVGGLPVDALLRREWWLEMGHGSQMTLRVFLECLERVLAEGSWDVIVFPFESQPWERMVVMAAHRHSVRTIGYQHIRGMPWLMLSYFRGEGEAEREPMPDVILTSGSYQFQMLLDGGLPAHRLRMAGSWRAEGLTALRRLSRDGADPGTILVALPINKTIIGHLLAALREAFPDGGRSDGITLLVRAHPAAPVDLRRLGFAPQRDRGLLVDSLARCGVVLYAETSTGIEAVLAGRAVLRYRSDALLNVDHGDLLSDDDVPSCSEDDLRERLLATVDAVRRTGLRLYQGDVDRKVAAPVDESVWRAALQPPAAHQALRPPDEVSAR